MQNKLKLKKLKFKTTPDEDISNNKDTSFQTGLAPTELHNKWRHLTQT
jgi:hypothetical protein